MGSELSEYTEVLVAVKKDVRAGSPIDLCPRRAADLGVLLDAEGTARYDSDGGNLVLREGVETVLRERSADG